jgi:hypothetical protein
MAHYTSFESLKVYKKIVIFCNKIREIIINTTLSKNYKP